jgi:hypothetical protein
MLCEQFLRILRRSGSVRALSQVYYARRISFPIAAGRDRTLPTIGTRAFGWDPTEIISPVEPEEPVCGALAQRTGDVGTRIAAAGVVGVSQARLGSILIQSPSSDQCCHPKWPGCPSSARLITVTCASKWSLNPEWTSVPPVIPISA